MNSDPPRINTFICQGYLLVQLRVGNDVNVNPLIYFYLKLETPLLRVLSCSLRARCVEVSYSSGGWKTTKAARRILQMR
jgi:hypothetical protein